MLEVRPVACLRDNYAYLVGLKGQPEVVVVDPSEAEPIAAALAAGGQRLVALLNTHHHYDHVGGNEALVARFGPLPVVAHQTDRGRVPGQTVEVLAGDVLSYAGMRFEVLHVPGHTLGAVAYAGHGVVFTGDTLFAGGCGRLFEGTAAMMHHSLNVTLGQLPDDSLVYPGHEYTENNLRFALTLEPTNEALRRWSAAVEAQRRAGQPSVPSSLGQERAGNPFLRCASPALRASLAERLPTSGPVDEVAVFAAARAAKDAF